MSNFFDQLHLDVRFEEGLVACINCGVCTAVCPAAEFYNYDPRQIVDTVQSRNESAIEALLKSETIWYCGECMSCRPRCPRGNTPGYIIQALRNLSQRTGLFVESEKGRQQLALKRVIGQGIIDNGYCLTPRAIDPDLHPEQGPVWRWIYDNHKEVYALFTDNYASSGAGPVRKIDDKTMGELRNILEQTGCMELFETIEEHSDRKAREMGFDGADQEYLKYISTTNSGNHQ